MRTFGSTAFTSEYLVSLQIRLEGLDATFSVDFVERTLPFGESHVDPRGRHVTVERIDVGDNFQYSGVPVLKRRVRADRSGG